MALGRFARTRALGRLAASTTLEGFYPGFPGFVTGEERSRMAYGDNLARLADLKAESDPENLLHSNLNVVPANCSP